MGWDDVRGENVQWLMRQAQTNLLTGLHYHTAEGLTGWTCVGLFVRSLDPHRLHLHGHVGSHPEREEERGEIKQGGSASIRVYNLQCDLQDEREKRKGPNTKKKKTQRTDRPMRPWNWGAYILPQPRLQIPVPESGRLGRYFNAQTLNRCCCIWYLSGSLSFPGETDKSRLAPPHQPSTSRIEKLYYHHYCHYYHIFGDYPSSGPVARAISGGETSRKWSCAHVW